MSPAPPGKRVSGMIQPGGDSSMRRRSSGRMRPVRVAGVAVAAIVAVVVILAVIHAVVAILWTAVVVAIVVAIVAALARLFGRRR